jgi:hypothetical protein
MLRREFIKGVKAGEVRFPDQRLSVPPGLAPVLGALLDQLLPERDVLCGLSAVDLEGGPVAWYLVLPGLLVKICGWLSPSADARGEPTLKLEHEFLPVVRIAKVRACMDSLTCEPAGGAPETSLEVLHDSGSWTIAVGECLDPAGTRRFAAILLGEMAR